MLQPMTLGGFPRPHADIIHGTWHVQRHAATKCCASPDVQVCTMPPDRVLLLLPCSWAVAVVA
jgi:hypothetical protein